MLTMLRPALVLLALFTLLTGVLYPLLVTGLARAMFPYRAGGSLLHRPDGELLGSALLGQSFTDPRYFWGRPSATRPGPYNAAAAAASNLGPMNPALHATAAERIAALRAAHPGMQEPVPADLVSASASGLDPHISPAAARYQVLRVATARGWPESQVLTIVEAHTEQRTLGVLGEPRVDVLRLNKDLDARP